MYTIYLFITLDFLKMKLKVNVQWNLISYPHFLIFSKKFTQEIDFPPSTFPKWNWKTLYSKYGFPTLVFQKIILQKFWSFSPCSKTKYLRLLPLRFPKIKEIIKVFPKNKFNKEKPSTIVPRYRKRKTPLGNHHR